jgi:uncharacterized protein
MRLEGTGKLLRIFVGERDRHGIGPLYSAIVAEARRAGLAGATVFRGLEGYGGHSLIHKAGLFDVSSDLPVLVEIVDIEEKVRGFLPVLDRLVREGLVTMETVEVIQYRHGAEKARKPNEGTTDPVQPEAYTP